MKKNANYEEKRNDLIAISQPFRNAVKVGEIHTINEAVIELYKKQNPDIKEFRTFNQWKKIGKSIIKGSKAFAVWAQPTKIKHPDPVKAKEDEEFQYFPLCYLFANTQVI